ncbi:MAG: response regulator [Candidatus Lindowbacteria bacterium]|nr:response regulator [Candidatus Lindowbacteria bacterium]
MGNASTFTITFDVKTPEASTDDDLVQNTDLKSEVAINQSTIERDPSKKLILIVDDQADARYLLREMLAELDCQIIEASGGQAGVDMAQKFLPDLITLDVMMPGKDGLTVLNELKAESKTREIPVVVISIVANDNRSKLSSAHAYINKPVSSQDVLQVVREGLDIEKNSR